MDTFGNGYFAGNVTANGVVYTSDREQKTDFERVNQSEILDKVASLPLTTWRFKDDKQEIHHMGPMAQDFYTAFGLGADDKHINASDISGVALAAIQGLNEKLEKKDRIINELLAEKDTEIEKLKARLSKMDALEARLVQISRQLASLSTTGEPLAD